MSSQAKQFVAGTAPTKKPTVAQTCNQLSLFLKERGCLRDLRLGINTKSDDTARMTVDLLSNMENPDENKAKTEKLTNLKPEDSGRSAESKTTPMTIFYDGKVIVFDDVPADKARDLMLAAGDFPSSTGKTDYRVELPANSTHLANVRASDQAVHVQVQANGLDLPIARRASLHKFLAKRKDRATVRAPYQLHNPSSAAGDFKHERNFDLNL